MGLKSSTARAPASTCVLLATLCGMAPLAGAQSITVVPAGPGVAAIPVDNPWALLALSLALGLGAWRVFRQRQHRTLLMALWGTALLAGMLWQSPVLRAQIVGSFTNPAGETRAIPVVPVLSGSDIQGFSAADFSNATGLPLKINALQQPDFAQCFPGGAGNLLPPGSPAPTPPAPCSVGDTLAPNSVCRVDVESICRAQALASSATLSVTPTTLSFAAGGTGVATVTNTSSSVAAQNVVATSPGGSGLSLQSSTCSASLPPQGSCTLTLAAAMQEGPTTVTVNGSNTNTVNLSVTVTAGPAATSLSPTVGPTSGGAPVTVTGAGFELGSTSVSIGGTTVPAGAVTVNSATSLSFVIPAHAAGNVAVTVTTTAGTSAPVPGGFLYADAPIAASLSPSAGSTLGGTSVTLSGTNFIAGQTSVTIDGLPAPATVNSATSLSFTTPAHSAGNVAVAITTPAGTSSPVPGGYTYVAAPTSSSLSPAFGPVAGGTSVSVMGTNFTPGDAAVQIGGVNIPPGAVTVNSATSLTFTTPAHVAGNVAVSVTTSGGNSAAVPGGFTYAGVPTAASMFPPSGNVAGGNTVIITGSNFVVGDTSVTIGGTVVPAGAVTVNSATSLTFTTPAHAAGNVAVSVSTSGGTSGTVPGGFNYQP